MDEELMIVHLLSDAHNLQGSWGGATVRQDYATMMMMMPENISNYHERTTKMHKFKNVNNSTTTVRTR